MNKTILRYNQMQRRSFSPGRMVAMLFFKCSKIMDTIALNIEKKDYYAQCQNSEKIVMTLTNLTTVFDEKNPETRDFVQEMKNFCILLLSFVTEINQKEDLNLCAHTSKLLHDMGDIWQNVE